MNGEPRSKRTENRAGLGRFSPIQLAIAGLGCAVILVILVLVVSMLAKAS
jgi:hypothetical protein